LLSAQDKLKVSKEGFESGNVKATAEKHNLNRRTLGRWIEMYQEAHRQAHQAVPPLPNDSQLADALMRRALVESKIAENLLAKWGVQWDPQYRSQQRRVLSEQTEVAAVRELIAQRAAAAIITRRIAAAIIKNSLEQCQPELMGVEAGQGTPPPPAVRVACPTVAPK
jgi:hypothetical protein